MKYSEIDKKIIILLYKSHGKLDSFTLFKRLKINMKDFMLAVSKLQRDVIVDCTDRIICLTEKGAVAALTIKSYDNIVKEWRQVPKKYLVVQHQVDEPYIPSISMLDKNAFN